MGLSNRLSKRLIVLEARQAPNNVLGDRWPPVDCDPVRRLARYTAYFEGRLWNCTGTPVQKICRETKLTRYKAYFDQLETGVPFPRWGE